ncbi:MAG: hypothetical protein HZC54_18545 [Verrucomicrobia bacterium]|nr:hypothetical protein [Verrucomicrobiota bacterium]
MNREELRVKSLLQNPSSVAAVSDRRPPMLRISAVGDRRYRVLQEPLKSEELGRPVVRPLSTFSPPPPSRFASSSGFSLVEVMLAIGIVAFAVVGVLTAFPVGIEAARDARDENTAALIADDIFTRLRSQPFGGPVVWPEVPMKRQAAGFKADYTGRTPIASMFYYARDGRPANANTTADGRPPTATSTYKSDEGYFGIRIYVNNDPYNALSSYYLKLRNDNSVVNWSELAFIIVEVSWPARTPFNNRKFKREFETHIANLH